jgi:hypothetical protein
LITCTLTKLESALDTLKKSYPKLLPADVAMVNNALVLTGRHALALYEGEKYVWPDDVEKLTQAMVPTIMLALESAEPVKKSKTAPEEEPIGISVGLMPNYEAGEALLKDRDDLKSLLSDILQGGVEFSYQHNDVGWQWALDRANWNTISEQEVSRKVKVKTAFTEGASGVEIGTGTTKKRKSSPKAEEPKPEEEA